MDVLAMWAMRKDSARGTVWRYGLGVAILEVRLRCWFPPVASSPEKAGAQMKIDARWFLAIPDNKRNAKAR
jgi:hypothetical protein